MIPTKDELVENSLTDATSMPREQDVTWTTVTQSKTTSDLQLFMIGLKITIGIVGFFGNTMVCIVLRKMKSEKVNFLIGSQATIDLIASVVMIADAFSNALYPSPVPNHPIRGYLFCMLWHWTTVLFCLFSASTYNLIAIAVERYIAILHPIYHRTKFSHKKAIILGCVAWSLSPIMQLVFALTQEFYHNGECVFRSNPPLGRALIGIFLFIWDFFMPCMIMGFSSARICLVIIAQSKQDTKPKAKISKKPSLSSKSNDALFVRKYSTAARNRRTRSISVTFVVVVIAYITCWSTDQFLFLQRNLGGHKFYRDAIYHFSNAMAMFNSAINPIIYVFCMKKYREIAKSLFWKRRREMNSSSRGYGNMSNVQSEATALTACESDIR